MRTHSSPGIRKAHPDKEWFQVAGLIHDIGKLMAVWGEPQWCVVGDTFPVGCAPSKHIVFDANFFAGNTRIILFKYNFYRRVKNKLFVLINHTIM
jgi:inositol oxygenase